MVASPADCATTDSALTTFQMRQLRDFLFAYDLNSSPCSSFLKSVVWGVYSFASLLLYLTFCYCASALLLWRLLRLDQLHLCCHLRRLLPSSTSTSSTSVTSPIRLLPSPASVGVHGFGYDLQRSLYLPITLEWLSIVSSNKADSCSANSSRTYRRPRMGVGVGNGSSWEMF